MLKYEINLNITKQAGAWHVDKIEDLLTKGTTVIQNN